MRLIERFYLPSSGRVLLDGRDVGLYDPHWLKRRVALVSQEPVLYARRSIPNLSDCTCCTSAFVPFRLTRAVLWLHFCLLAAA